MDFPYRVEYAKSSRASCRSCKSSIQKEALRLAAMVQSSKFDGRTPQWYHFECFFSKQRPKICDDIENFEDIRWEDQEKIKDKIKNLGSIIVPAGKGKKRAAADNGALKDYTLEYSKSSRAMCRGCQQKIMKDDVRISKKDFESEAAKKYNGQDMWHHLTCFAKLRSELGYFECGDKLPGFKSLKKSDQDEVIKEIPAIKQENGSDIKKVKKEEEEDPLDKELIKQNKKMYTYKDNLKNQLKKTELQLLLEENNQAVPPGESEILSRLADVMTFGALLPCSVCKEGQLVFNKDGYYCQGDATEWAKCSEFVEQPKRKKFVVPGQLAEKYSFLQKYHSSVKHRVFKKITPTVKVVKKDDEDDKPKVQREVPPLYDMQFILELKKNKEMLKKEIMNLGGSVVTKISENVMAVISTADQVDKMGSRMSSIKEVDIQVVSSDFVKKAKEYKGRIPELILKKSICDWGSDPTARLPAEPSVSYKSKSKSTYAKSGPSTVKLKLKGGTAVDPESKLDHKSHVYQEGKDKYTVILGLTDIQKNKNSYYKLQLLEADNRNEYWLFRSWGRIGTSIGDSKVEPQLSLFEAKNAFETLYEEKTGNEWEYRHEFTKVPGRMYPIDVDYEDDNKLDITNIIESKLPAPVQKLMQLIFNVKIMKDLMLEFELDTEKMPLGKLSVNQMKKAFDVLSELQQLIQNKGSKTKLIDASNRFYTYVPHSFGIKELPIIENEEQIRQKTEMIENLMEVEFAYNLMKSSNSGIDGHYAELNTEIGVLDRDSKEFKTIEKYVQNTHASTHNTYELEIIEIFTVKRSGEEKRFKPFKKLHNRQLLWHGSRVTNFAGILKQGLRIAPRNAPTTGYMFGKGIYFADMVSKSANYCYTMAKNPTGLLLLCDVALGNMYERSKADYIQKLPAGKHSCKGVGSTYPDEKEKIKLGDVDVPLGKPVNDTKVKSDLLYNEYIVYDVAQVNVKYLLQLNFKYKF